MEQFIVCYSGGHSSALVAIEAVRKYGKERVVLLNHDISSKVEHEDIKRFKQDVADYLDLPITYANADGFEDLTPLEVSRRRKGFSVGNHQTFCTYYLKTQPFCKFLEAIPKSKSVHIAYGFDAEETNRIYRRESIIRSMGYYPVFPLADWERTIEKTEEVGITRPVTYKIFRHANCIGCLKAGKQHWYCVYCMCPDIWEEAKETEAELGYSIINGTYLDELELQFREMRDDKGICPSEKMNHQAFWAEVDRRMPGEQTLMPCDCSF